MDFSCGCYNDNMSEDEPPVTLRERSESQEEHYHSKAKDLEETKKHNPGNSEKIYESLDEMLKSREVGEFYGNEFSEKEQGKTSDDVVCEDKRKPIAIVSGSIRVRKFKSAFYNNVR